MTEKSILSYLPVTVAISMVGAAVWINGSLANINTSVVLLTEKVLHSNELHDIRFAAIEARTATIELRGAEERAMLQWIIQFKAMNPELPTPELP